MGNCNCFKADLECARFANVVGPVISRRLELRYVDMYLGMLNDTENDRQCSRHREIKYGCYSRTVYLPIIIGIILQDESHLNEMEI